MKRLVCLASLIFAACDVPPAWDGNPASCDYVVQGACVRGDIDRDVVEDALEKATELFGPFSPDGWLIEKVDRVECGKGTADGCNESVIKRIQIATHSVWCDKWLLVHEFGHIALPKDNYHESDVWGVLQNKLYWPICDIRYP